MTSRCPRCQGTDRIQLGRGFYECTSRVIVGEVPPGVAGPAPIPQWGVCGHRYQEAPRTEVPQCHVDGCGLYSVGVCVQCGRPICGLHLERVDGRTLCPTDAAQARAAKAQDEAQRHQDRRTEVTGWVDTLGRTSSADEVLEAITALRPLVGMFGSPTGFRDLDVEPPTPDQLRHAWRTLRTGLGYPAQLELVDLHGTGWKGATPAYSGSSEPLWGYALYYRVKGDYGEVRESRMLVAINESGDVYASRDQYGRPDRAGWGALGERAPWDNKYGYVRRAGDGLRRRKDFVGSAWWVAAAPRPQHPTMRDLAEWAAHGNAPADELLTESPATWARHLASVPEGVDGVGDWY